MIKVFKIMPLNRLDLLFFYLPHKTLHFCVAKFSVNNNWNGYTMLLKWATKSIIGENSCYSLRHHAIHFNSLKNS